MEVVGNFHIKNGSFHIHEVRRKWEKKTSLNRKKGGKTQLASWKVGWCKKVVCAFLIWFFPEKEINRKMFWCVEHNLIKNDNKGILLYVYDAIQYAPEYIEK